MAFKKNIPIEASDGNRYVWGGYQFFQLTKSGRRGRIANRDIKYELESKIIDNPSKYIDLDTKSVFFDLYSKSIKSGFLPERTKDAIDWMRKRVRNAFVSRNKVLQEKTTVSKFEIGKLYFFSYDATTKEKLPYWDMYPIVYPFGMKDGDMMGINLHYLPLNLRAKLQDALYMIVTDFRFDNETKLKISYNILKNSSELKPFKPCVHRYKMKGIKSSIIEIHPSTWTQALFLPLHKFVKQKKGGENTVSANKVHKDSKKKI